MRQPVCRKGSLDQSRGSALFQQRPAPEEGDYFQADWLRPVEMLPPREQLLIYGASDYAVTARGGDYTVHVVVGIDAVGRMYLLDLWRRQAASNVWIEAFCDLVLQWRPIGWRKSTARFMPASARSSTSACASAPRSSRASNSPPRGDKAVRARSIRGRMALEGLYVPAAAPWLADFRAELLSFPTGRHDDQVDAIGLIGQQLDQMVPPAKVKPKAPTMWDRWDREERDRPGWNWKTV